MQKSKSYGILSRTKDTKKKGIGWMQTVTFDVETLTPLFLAGVDQTKAELRAPSFRGLMRYWLRALVGGAEGTDARGLEKVMKAETAIFGATDTGSTVAVKVSGASSEAREFTEQ